MNDWVWIPTVITYYRILRSGRRRRSSARCCGSPRIAQTPISNGNGMRLRVRRTAILLRPHGATDAVTLAVTLCTKLICAGRKVYRQRWVLGAYGTVNNLIRHEVSTGPLARGNVIPPVDHLVWHSTDPDFPPKIKDPVKNQMWNISKYSSVRLFIIFCFRRPEFDLGHLKFFVTGLDEPATFKT